MHELLVDAVLEPPQPLSLERQGTARRDGHLVTQRDEAKELGLRHERLERLPRDKAAQILGEGRPLPHRKDTSFRAGVSDTGRDVAARKDVARPGALQELVDGQKATIFCMFANTSPGLVTAMLQKTCSRLQRRTGTGGRGSALVGRFTLASHAAGAACVHQRHSSNGTDSPVLVLSMPCCTLSTSLSSSTCSTGEHSWGHPLLPHPLLSPKPLEQLETTIHHASQAWYAAAGTRRKARTCTPAFLAAARTSVRARAG